MPAARAWFRIGSVAVPAGAAMVGAGMVMSGSCGAGCRVVGCALRYGLDPGDRDQGEADVAQLVQQAVQGGLVDDRTPEQGAAVTGGQGHAVEAGGPSGVEPPLEADLVPAGPVRAAGGCGAHDRKLGADVVSRHHIVW